MTTHTLTARAGAELHRELRTARGALIALPVTVTACVVGLRLLAARLSLDPATVAGLAGLVGYTSALLILGAETVAGERMRGTLSSIARTPGGLAAAWRVKLATFLGSVVVSTVGALALAVALDATRVHDALRLFDDMLTPAWIIGALPAVALALWTFAVSAWVPTGVLALPAAVLVLGGWGALIWYAPGWFERSGPNAIDSLAFVAAAVVGGAFATRLSFIHGLRPDGGPGRASAWSLGIAALALLPVVGMAAGRPDVRELSLSRALERGYHYGLSRPVFDPESNRVLVQVHVGEGPHSVLDLIRGWPGWQYSLPSREDRTTRHVVAVYLADGKWESAPRVRAEARPLAEAYTRAWESLEQQPDLTAHGLSETTRVYTARGLGRYVRDHRDAPHVAYIYDPIREVVHDNRELTARWATVFVRHADWLVQPGPARADAVGPWLRLHPTTGETTPALGIGEDERPIAIWSDDRVVVKSDLRAALVDPVSGRRVEFQLPERFPPRTLAPSSWFGWPRTQDDELLFVGENHDRTLCRLDEQTSSLVPIVRIGQASFHPPERLPDGRVLAYPDGQSIVIVDPQTARTTVLFP